MILLAMLPVSTKVGKVKIKAAEAQSTRSRIILDYALDKALSALYGLAADGIELQCCDGQLRFYFPVICGWLADHLEHVTLQHLKNNACPVCEIDATYLGKLSTASPPDHDGYKKQANHYEVTGNVKDLNWLQQKGMKALTNSFWQLPMVLPEAIWKPDLLYNIFLGLLKYLMEWIQGFLDKHNRFNDFDRVQKSIPPYPGITIPKKPYRKVV